METVTEIRRQNLNFLIEQYQTIANLNLARETGPQSGKELPTGSIKHRGNKVI